MLYAALGDSITFGYDATTDEAAYVHRFVRMLTKNSSVNLYLHAKPGWTSKQLAKSLNKVPDVIFAEARLVTIMVGGNDVLKAAPWLLNGNEAQIYKVAQRLYENLEEIVQKVQSPGTKIIVGTLYNPFPNSIMAEEYMDTINRSIYKIVNQYKLRVADVRKVFHSREHRLIKGYKQGSLRDLRFIRNPIHPNDLGHAAIARTFLRAYRGTSAKPRQARQRASHNR